MRHLTKLFVLSTLCFLFFSTSANAQLFGGDNFGIYPPTGPLNPNAPFTSIGESGGVPGPTVSGCDLYGFRAQLDLNNSINLGMQRVSPFADFPALSFSGRPWIISQEGASGPSTGPDFGCGKILAAFNDGALGGTANSVFLLFGSGFASGGMWVPSDLNLKENIRPVTDALRMLQSLNGVTYDYKVNERPELNLNRGRQYGFIAQEVQRIMPEAVQRTFDAEGNESDFETMNYDMIIPVLTEAIKEQQAQIEVLTERLDRLERGQRRSSGATAPTTDMNPSASASKIGLEQNRPNPFSGSTVIEYDIPLDVENAQLVIYNTKGNVLQIKDLASGKGSVNFNANNLSGGVYIYAVEINGEPVVRKKMIVK